MCIALTVTAIMSHTKEQFLLYDVLLLQSPLHALFYFQIYISLSNTAIICITIELFVT